MRSADAVAHALGAGRATEVQDLATGRGLVARVRFAEPLDDVGSSVIVKRRDDVALDGWAAKNRAVEVSMLRWLGGHAPGVAPRLLAEDVDGDAFVLEDTGTCVLDLLLGEDGDAARHALRELGRVTARLHLAPLPPLPLEEAWSIVNRVPAWEPVGEIANSLGLPDRTAGVEEEHAAVHADLRSPGSSAAVVHGDLGPNNATIDAEGRCRLIDFEGSGIHHVGLDATMLRFPFPWMARWHPVAFDVQRSIEVAYRETLGRPDDEVDEAVAVGTVAMTNLRLERLSTIADPTQDAASAVRRRSQIVWTCEVAAPTVAERFPASAAWYVALADGFRRLWPDSVRDLPTYPALR